MIPNMLIQALDENEIAKIHAAMVSILGNTGLLVEHEKIREKFASYGAQIDHNSKKVLFPENVINRFLSETEPSHPPRDDAPWIRRDCYKPLCPGGTPSMSTRSGISHGMYLEPGNNRTVQFTEKSLANYIQLARNLDNRIIIRIETLPVGEARVTQPLEARLFSWKHGAMEGGSIQVTELCPYLYEMYEIKADAAGKTLEDVFCGSVYIISPLRLPNDLCEQILYFHDRGLRVRVGNMFSIGGTGPVTLAGCLALGLAECIGVGILNRILYGDNFWIFYGEMAPLDMRTMVMQLGRPEMLLLNLAVIQLAKHYGVPAHPLGGTTDAMRPSYQAGMQKLMSALPCILAGGCNFDAGRLGIDSLYSPIQMILDAEVISSIRRMLTGFEVNADTLAVDVIDEVGAGGLFMSTMHTVKHMRAELWQSKIWSGETIQSWEAAGGKIDIERAMDRWHDLMGKDEQEVFISTDTERRLQSVIDRATQNLSSG